VLILFQPIEKVLDLLLRLQELFLDAVLAPAVGLLLDAKALAILAKCLARKACLAALGVVVVVTIRRQRVGVVA
jgi:hypothetical protein